MSTPGGRDKDHGFPGPKRRKRRKSLRSLPATGEDSPLRSTLVVLALELGKRIVGEARDTPSRLRLLGPAIVAPLRAPIITPRPLRATVALRATIALWPTIALRPTVALRASIALRPTVTLRASIALRASIVAAALRTAIIATRPA